MDAAEQRSTTLGAPHAFYDETLLEPGASVNFGKFQTPGKAFNAFTDAGTALYGFPSEAMGTLNGMIGNVY